MRGCDCRRRVLGEETTLQALVKPSDCLYDFLEGRDPVYPFDERQAVGAQHGPGLCERDSL